LETKILKESLYRKKFVYSVQVVLLNYFALAFDYLLDKATSVNIFCC